MFLFTAWVFILTAGCKKAIYSEQDINTINITDSDLFDIIFLDSLRGYIVGGKSYTQSEILATNDGGNTWHKMNIELDMQKAIFGVTKVDNSLMAVGIDGKTYLNNGAPLTNWMALQTYRWHWYKSIAFTSNYRGVIVGGRAQTYGEINYVDVWGNASGEQFFEFELTDIIFTKEDIGFISGYGTILKSADTGLTWDTLNLKGDFFKALHFQESKKTLWTVGYNGSIFFSKDYGTSWVRVRNGNNPLFKSYAFNNVYFVNDTLGFIIGDEGCIMQTINGGSNWKLIKSYTKEDLHGIIHNPPYLFITGKNGYLAKIKY